MPWDHELFAAFYVDPPDEPEPTGWFVEQVERLGVEDVVRRRVVVAADGTVDPYGPGDPSGPEGAADGPLRDARRPLIDEDEVSGRWAGLGVEARDLHLGFFRAVTLVWSAEQVASARAELGESESVPSTETWFAEACDRLRPRAAVLVDTWQDDVEELVAGLGDPVLAIDADGLLDGVADLVYLSGSWFTDVSRLAADARGPHRPLGGGVVVGTLHLERGTGTEDPAGAEASGP